MTALIDVDYFRKQPLGSKALANISTEVVEEFIEEASAYVEDYLDRKIPVTSYVERIVGPGVYTLILGQMPIVALSSVSWDGYVLGDVGTHSPTDFLIHSGAGMIEWINKMYVWRTDRVYTIQYTAGYAVIPPPIRRATMLQTIQLMRPVYGGVVLPIADLNEVLPFAEETIVNLLDKYKRNRIS